jgi:hypothetical protein
MVETFVDESQTNNLDAEQLGNERVSIELRAETITRPEEGPHTIEKGVSGAFERQILWQFMHLEAMLLEPVSKMWLFGLTLSVQEAAQHGMIAQDQSCVRREDHVGRSREWRDQFDFSLTREEEVQAMPLFRRQRSVRAVDVAFHPGVDDIIDLEKLRWAHQVTFRGSHNKDFPSLAERSVVSKVAQASSLYLDPTEQLRSRRSDSVPDAWRLDFELWNRTQAGSLCYTGEQSSTGFQPVFRSHRAASLEAIRFGPRCMAPRL